MSNLRGGRLVRVAGWQVGTRRAVDKPNSAAGLNGVTKIWRVSCFVLSRHRSLVCHNRYDPKSSLARTDKRAARAARNTRYRYNQIGPLDHKMADNCVFLARTNTVSSTMTKLIKPRKTSNKCYSYNLLNRINKMYTHDLVYLQQEWEAWLAPIYKQIQTTKSQLTQCTKY